jgi:hypothetical protein
VRTRFVPTSFPPLFPPRVGSGAVSVPAPRPHGRAPIAAPAPTARPAAHLPTSGSGIAEGTLSSGGVLLSPTPRPFSKTPDFSRNREWLGALLCRGGNPGRT